MRKFEAQFCWALPLQDQGKFEYEMSPALMSKVLDDAVRAHEAAAAAAGVRLALNCDGSLRTVHLLMDAGRIGQVVTNVRSTAIKFTPRGGVVTVRAVVTASPGQIVEASASGGGGGGVGGSSPAQDMWTVRVSVTDTGGGLGPAELEKLFQPYTQIRASEMQAGCVGACSGCGCHDVMSLD